MKLVSLHCKRLDLNFAWLGWPRKITVLSTVVDVKTVSPISTFVLNTLTLKWIAVFLFLHSGARLATSSGDGTVKIWDFSKAECILTFTDHTHAVWGCSWHSCGDFLASCSMDNTSKVWDVNRYKRKPIGSCFSNDVGDGNENVKKKNDRFMKQNNFARASHFFVLFIAVSARLLRENTWFHVLWRT